MRVPPTRSLVFALPLLLACSRHEPSGTAQVPADPVDAPTEPEPTAPEPATPEPTAPEPTTPEPTEPTASAGPTWWCLCHESDDELGTTCHAAESDCRANEKQHGRALTHGCRTLAGEHPGDATRGRESWEAGEQAGVWDSDTACLLGGRAGHGPGAPTKGDPFEILTNETIGGLRLGMSTAEIEAKVGKPSAVDEPVGPNDGMYAQSWTYADAGMELVLVWHKPGGDRTLYSIFLFATDKTTTKLETARGIKLGSRWADVERAYADALYLADDEGEHAEHTDFVAGSLWGGLTFGFEDERVQSIMLAPVAD